MQTSGMIRLSKRLAYLLRHADGIGRDASGWVSCEVMILHLGTSMDVLIDIVNTDPKDRYEFSSEGREIRAVQGHSVPVELELKEVKSIKLLYHGTARKAYPYILKNGISRMSRNFVHLSKNKKTAFEVGSRHGNPVVIVINARELIRDGQKIYISKNGVYLTNNIAPRYFLAAVKK